MSTNQEIKPVLLSQRTERRVKGDIIYRTYACLCGRGTIEEEQDYTEGHRDGFAWLNCSLCDKKYFINFGQSETKWNIVKKNALGIVDQKNKVDKNMEGYMNYSEILSRASDEIIALKGRHLDVVDIAKASTLDYARQLSKVISKLSPLLGNMIEFSTVDLLNEFDWGGVGVWKRQDPGFPDATFLSESVLPNPGIEIKTWFPFATEITARFKDSVLHFQDDQISVAMIAWLPDKVLWGKPTIIDAWVGSAASVASARDSHYHRPPDYLVFEPEDTSSRTSNLQQTNTNGYKFQGSDADFSRAKAIVDSWGSDGTIYSTSSEYQAKLQSLLGAFTYRLDTNFAKMDRIEHTSLEAFKTRVLDTEYRGLPIRQWARLISVGGDALDSQLLRLINE